MNRNKPNWLFAFGALLSEQNALNIQSGGQHIALVRGPVPTLYVPDVGEDTVAQQVGHAQMFCAAARALWQTHSAKDIEQGFGPEVASLTEVLEEARLEHKAANTWTNFSEVRRRAWEHTQAWHAEPTTLAQALLVLALAQMPAPGTQSPAYLEFWSSYYRVANALSQQFGLDDVAVTRIARLALALTQAKDTVEVAQIAQEMLEILQAQKPDESPDPANGEDAEPGNQPSAKPDPGAAAQGQPDQGAPHPADALMDATLGPLRWPQGGDHPAWQTTMDAIVAQASARQEQVRATSRDILEQAAQAGTLDAPLKDGPCEALDQQLEATIAQLKRVFAQAFQGERQIRLRQQRVGRLDPRAIVSAVQGRTNVWKRVRYQVRPTAALSVVLDASGSMQGHRMHVARRSAYALAAACSGVPGFEVSALKFATRAGWLLKPHERARAVASRFATTYADGGTKMATALALAGETVLRSTMTHKVIAIVTDGAVSDYAKCAEMARILAKHNVHLVGIGIGQEAPGFCDEKITIENPAKLAETLQRTLLGITQ